MTPAEQAARHWDAQVVRLIGERENAVYEITLPRGEKAALRLHRAGYQSADAIRSELWWCDQLAAAGLPVPRPLPDQSGEILVTLPGGQFASAVSWVDGAPIGALGKPLAGSPAEQIDLHLRLGHLVAEIHSATDALTLPDWFTRPRWDREGLTGGAPLWGRFWDHPSLTPSERRGITEARDLLRARLAPGQPATADFGLIHADLLRENIFTNDHSLSVIDFDDSGYGFRGYDLGTAMIQNLAEPCRDDLLTALTEGYAAIRPMTESMVALFTLARVLASLGWAMERLPPDSPIHRSHIARALAWWETARLRHF